MRRAVDACELPPMLEETLWDYLQRAAYAMVNTFEPAGIGPAAGERASLPVDPAATTKE
jgi:hemoglobin